MTTNASEDWVRLNSARPVYLPALADHYEDNPHVCILQDLPCLACALIEVMGDEQRSQALDLARCVAANLDTARQR